MKFIASSFRARGFIFGAILSILLVAVSILAFTIFKKPNLDHNPSFLEVQTDLLQSEEEFLQNYELIRSIVFSGGHGSGVPAEVTIYIVYHRDADELITFGKPNNKAFVVVKDYGKMEDKFTVSKFLEYPEFSDRLQRILVSLYNGSLVLPSAIMEKITLSGPLTIVVREPTSIEEAGPTFRLYSNGKQQINWNILKFDSSVEFGLYHEFGHALYFSSPDIQKEYQSMFEKDQWFYSNIKEDFADNFALSLLNPETLRSANYQRYQFFRKLLFERTEG